MKKADLYLTHTQVCAARAQIPSSEYNFILDEETEKTLIERAPKMESEQARAQCARAHKGV